MPRRAAAKNHRREVQPDAVYNNRLVTQLINKVLLDGKKSTAERIVYGAFDSVAEKSGEDALSVFKKTMDNVRPTLEVKILDASNGVGASIKRREDLFKMAEANRAFSHYRF